MPLPSRPDRTMTKSAPHCPSALAGNGDSRIHFVALAYVAVIGFLINGLDDLFFDVGFLHFLWRSRKDRHLTLQDLKLVPEQWIALLVPAWQEGGVVNKMAEYASRICIYERYDIFIGVYPN